MKNFKHFSRQFPDDVHANLLMRKGIRTNMLTVQKKNNEKRLPDIDKFYSHLSGKTISQTEYEHAQKVWERMKICSLGDYHDLYLTLDVLLLADVFEHFRAKWITHHKLDPAHFYTLPGLSFSSALKITDGFTGDSDRSYDVVIV